MEIEIIKFLQSFSSGFLDNFFVIISYLASIFAVIFVFFILFIKNEKYSMSLCISYIIFWIICEITKFIIARPRPFIENVGIINKANALGYSMPSGHSFTAMFLAVTILYYIFTHTKTNWKKAISAVLLVLYVLIVGLSRMYLGVHYLSDVLVGYGLALFNAVLSLLFYNKYINNLNSRVPLSGEGGVSGRHTKG